MMVNIIYFNNLIINLKFLSLKIIRIIVYLSNKRMPILLLNSVLLSSFKTDNVFNLYFECYLILKIHETKREELSTKIN